MSSTVAFQKSSRPELSVPRSRVFGLAKIRITATNAVPMPAGITTDIRRLIDSPGR